MLLSFDVEKLQKTDVCIDFVKSDNHARILLFQSDGHWSFAKIFWMCHFKDSVKHKRYAFSELKNNILTGQFEFYTPRDGVHTEKRARLLSRCEIDK